MPGNVIENMEVIMKIESSNVRMKSDRSYYSHLEAHTEQVLLTSDKAATLEFSDESKSYVEQLKDYKEEQERQQKQQLKEQEKQNVNNLATAMAEAEKTRSQEGPTVQSKEDIQLETLKRILEMLKKMQNRRLGIKDTITMAAGVEQKIAELKKSTASAQSLTFGTATNLAGSGMVISSSGTSSSAERVMTFKRVTVQSSFYAEMEHTAYQSQGCVKTQDGREISFNVEVEMSRAFCEKYDSLTMEDYVCVDPLVLNLEGNVGQISDQKFLFDLNADGTEEEISFTGQGSGFLALDKNKDGIINDGSELFGTTSGDGFKDLAAYDEDGNGWIDENDAIFNDLSIWTLDDKGEKVLISLKDADVGAIYLGSASTEFSLKNEENHNTNGVIRSTGIFLKESGGAGTIQHIDLTI